MSRPAFISEVKNMKYNIANLLAKASTTNIPVVNTSAGGSSRFSMGIVNSKNNGKRLTFSKALSSKLGLAETVQMLPIMDEGVLLVAKDLPVSSASSGSLRGDEKKICYAASLVELLTSVFRLDFSEHVSRSFNDIQFEEHDGVTVAIIKMSAASDNMADEEE